MRFIYLFFFPDLSIAYISIPNVFYVFLYSFLPHKEIRFIFPALVIFNLTAACILLCLSIVGMARLYRLLPSSKTIYSICMVGMMTKYIKVIIQFNYYFYNGRLFKRKLSRWSCIKRIACNSVLYFQSLIPPNNFTVHIDVFSVQSGVSHFGEIQNWKYNRSETVVDYNIFDFLITSAPSIHNDFQIIKNIKGFNKINIKKFRIEKSNKIFIMKNNRLK